MKRFSVPVKDTHEDYTLNSDLWLTVNELKKDYSICKYDNKSEILILIFHDNDNSQQDIPISENLYKTFLTLKEESFALIYCNSYDKTIITNNIEGLFPVVFRKAQNCYEIIENNDKTHFNKNDSFICFTSKINEDCLNQIITQIHTTKNISYALLNEIKEIPFETSLPFPIFLIDYSPHHAYNFPIASSLKTVALTIEMIKNKVLKHQTDKIWQIETVLHEALVNAITYGNEIDNNKQILVSYEIGEHGLRVIIRDKGEGFDVNNISVPVGEEALERISGRGIYIMKKFSDALFYNEKGNEVILFFNF